MESLNKVMIIGNMTRIPEIKTTPNGVKIAMFSVATNRSWKDANGEKKSEVEFHNIVAWDKLAELIEKFGEKGQRVYVEGYLKTRTWDDEAGKKNYRTEVIALSWMMTGSRPGSSVPVPEAPEGIVKQPAPADGEVIF